MSSSSRSVNPGTVAASVSRDRGPVKNPELTLLNATLDFYAFSDEVEMMEVNYTDHGGKKKQAKAVEREGEMFDI